MQHQNHLALEILKGHLIKGCFYFNFAKFPHQLGIHFFTNLGKNPLIALVDILLRRGSKGKDTGIKGLKHYFNIFSLVVLNILLIYNLFDEILLPTLIHTSMKKFSVLIPILKQCLFSRCFHFKSS